MIVDLFLVFSFIRKLVSPFEKWEAYKLGIIDENGNILIRRKDFTLNAQKAAFGIFDQMILNLKKLLGKLPGGQTKLASYAAALWLIREQQRIEATNYLTEESVEEDLEVALERFLSENETLIAEAARREIDEEPANAVGGGNIAGLGIGPDGEPGVSKKNQKKHKKRIRDIMGTVKMEDAVAQANLKARQAAEIDNLKDRQDKEKERTKLKHAAEAERLKAADEVEKDREKRKQERDKEREAARQKMAGN
jgi:hypothetical protein